MMFDLLTRVKNRICACLWSCLFRGDFFSFGDGTIVINPLRIQGARWISIGKKVIILDSAWFLAMPQGDGKPLSPLLEIGDGTYIGHFAHIVTIGSVKIGKKVLIADRVYISDNLHGFENIKVPIIDQPITFKGPVLIGDGSWIGENVCIIGANIGRQSVVAANSVVTKDIPDFCVVAGAPARIIKQFDHEANAWVKVDSEKE